jgi:hypothetical protein
VIPVAPWHFTTWLDLFDHWQTVIAGVLAFVAGFGTVVATMIIARRQIAASREEADRVIAATREQTHMTIRLERERVSSELDALRKSLAVELRQQIPRALAVYDSLKRWSSKPGRQITARMVEHLSRMPAPIIFSASAGKIGLLEDDAMDVLIVYTLLEGARDGVDRLITTYGTPDDVAPVVVLAAANTFLGACEYARGVLPKLRTGVASHDAKDEALTQRINAALAARRA